MDKQLEVIDKQQIARHYQVQSQLAQLVAAAQEAVKTYEAMRWHVPCELATRLNALRKIIGDMR